MHFLITSGGTREYIDTVRFISNASSGKMGCALARAALKAGHRVTLIAASMTAEPSAKAELVRVETAAQMYEAVKACFAECDCLIMAAAVSDYAPAKRSREKIKKDQNYLVLRFKRTRDILRWAGRNKSRGQVVVGFALEDRNLKINAAGKLRDKKLDMIAANYPASIDSLRSDVYIKRVGADWVELLDRSKTVIAGRIIALAEELVTGFRQFRKDSR